MKTITSRQNPAVRAFRDLAEHPDPTGARLLLEGAHLVRDAADAGLEFELACIATSKQERRTEEGTLAAVLASHGVEVIAVPDPVFAAVSPVRSPSGIVAIGRRHPITAADLCSHSSPLVVVAVDVQDPGNVGAVIRVGEAAGATGAFMTGASANPFSWKALRGSMGSALRLPVIHTVPLPQVQECLRGAAVRTIAAVPRAGVDPETVDWRGGVAILVGGEGAGLTEDVVAASDARVTIPMAPQVDSLNVAVAAAILLYTARRQRLGRGLSASPARA
jgi:RNA methyltransferase, TrmH family